MNLSQLSDKELMRKTKCLVRQESELLLTILHHLKEIDRRRLYADFKQPGLLELVMTELGYPRDQALRRILAMRMMRENPIVEAKIQSGELNLTTIGIVQTLFSHQKKEGKPFSTQEKLTVIQQVCGKSTRDAQRIVFSMSSAPIKLNEKIKMIAVDRYELTAVIDEETVSIIENLKGLLAHAHPSISNGELIKMLGKIGLKELERVKSGQPLSSTKSFNQNRLAPSVKSVAAPRPNSQAEIKRQIWHRDDHKCTNCDSTFAIEEDHRFPKAKGGQYTTTNMRLLCRACNQRAAIKQFGTSKMDPFLSTRKNGDD